MKLIALLAGLTVALGSYLNHSSVGTTKWIGLAVLLSGVATLVLCFCVSRKQKKTIYELHEQLTDFLEGRGETPKFSTDDNTFALLENDVVELENRLLLEHNNRQKEMQKNAEFIADISHQLKTPLAALRLYCEMDNGLSYWEESAEILPAGTGSVYYKQIAKNSSCTWSFKVTATTTAQSKPHPATITMEYEDSDGNAISTSDRIILQVRQPVRLNYEEPSLPLRVTQGDTPSFTMTLMNLGKSTIYNALLKFEIPGLSSGGSVLIGTIPPGESQTGTTNLRVESEPLGKVTGTLLLSYEDEYSEHYEKKILLSTTIEEKKEVTVPKKTDTARTASKFPGWIIWAAAGTLFVLICYFVSSWLKQKKQREEDEMRL